MYARASLAVVDAAFALVDSFLSGSNLFHLLLSFKSAILEKSAVACHGPFLLLRLWSKPRCKFSLARKDGYCFCCWGFHHWLSRKCLLSCCPRNRVHLNGYRSLVSCSSKGPCLSCLSKANRLSIFFFKSGIAQGGGLTQTYHSSAEQYSSGFSLALRMISVAAGVTIGLFVSQVIGVSVLLTLNNAAIYTFCASVFVWKSQKCCPFRLLISCLSVLFLGGLYYAICFYPKNTYECNIVVFLHDY